MLVTKIVISLLGGLVIVSAFKHQQSNIKRQINILLASAMVIVLMALWFK